VIAAKSLKLLLVSADRQLDHGSRNV